MPLRCRRLAFPVTVAVSIILVWLLIRNTNFPSQRLGFSGSTLHCRQGFYTKKELRPHIERPPQNPLGPGAHGQSFSLKPENLWEIGEERSGYEKHDFNQFVSDRISLHRDLGEDTRHPACKAQKFPRCPGLPTTSVIIVFYNEAWSTLLRTVYSVLHTAPAAVLTEILLVDDASTRDHLKERLDDFVQQLKIVRVLRQKERKGLTKARLLGACAAKGEVLTFLDSHCECYQGWLEPLLARIAELPSAVVSPDVVSIDRNTFKFRRPDPLPNQCSRGNFNWKLVFGWESIPEDEKKRRKNETSPLRTPTFVGGLFSISKEYFEHIGTYDDQMEFWGGENLEMSFRVWQCGGQLEIIPCSIVGHIYRTANPHPFPNRTTVIIRNLVRLAEVWLDDYKQVFYRVHKKAASISQEKSFGDVSERLKLRERLQCKSFSWYLNNIYPEAYVPDIWPLKYGQIKNMDSFCLLDATVTSNHWDPVQNFKCRYTTEAKTFEYTSQREIRITTATMGYCLEEYPGRTYVSLKSCKLKGKGTKAVPEQQWILTKTNRLINLSSGHCMTVSTGGYVKMSFCKTNKLSQAWFFV